MGNSNSGRGGLPPAVRGEIFRLLASGMKKAHVARAVGVNETTIYRLIRRAREAAEPAALDDAPVRCGGCGGLVLASEPQCRVCLYRKTHGRRERRPRRSQKARIAA